MNVILLVFCSILPLISTKNHTGGKVDFLSFSPRIIGGSKADPTPYQCAMSFNRKYYCGCVIISSTWILTSAYCLQSELVAGMEIMVGSNVLEQGTYYKAEKFISHEKYVYLKYPYNIGLIRVQGALELNNNVQPIPFSNKVIKSDIEGIATGWGPNPEQHRENLEMIQSQIVSIERCNELLEPLPFPIEMPQADESMICTTSMDKGVCSDDSGGPLVADNELVGIINWAWPCGNVGKNVNGYARISYYYDWIQSHIS